MFEGLFNRIKAAVPQMVAGASVMGVSAVINAIITGLDKVILEDIKKNENGLERGIVTIGAVKLREKHILDYIKSLEELEHKSKQVYTKEQYEKDMAEYRKEKFLTDATLVLMTPFIAAEQICRGFGEGLGAFMAFPEETVQEVVSGIFEPDPSKNTIVAPLHGVYTQTGPLFRGELTPEELVQYQVNLFTLGMSTYGTASTISNVSSKVNNVIKTRTAIQSTTTSGGSGVKISEAVDEIAINSLDDIAKEVSEEAGKSNPSSQITGRSYDINKLHKTQSYTYKDNVDIIKDAIIEQGPNAITPIEVRVHNGQALVVEGHHRLEAFRQLGYDRVPIKYIHSNQLGKTQADGFTYYRSLQELLDGVVD